MTRIQRRRTKGWRMPEGAIVVSRPSPWGNPFPWKGEWIMWTAVTMGFKADEPGRRAAAVELYRAWMSGAAAIHGTTFNPTGGELEYSDGTVAGMGVIVQGLAGFMANKVGGPILPKRPALEPLRGADALCCWCPLDQSCHADVLIELLEVWT